MVLIKLKQPAQRNHLVDQSDTGILKTEIDDSRSRIDPIKSVPTNNTDLSESPFSTVDNADDVPKIRIRTSKPSSGLRIKVKFKSEPGIGYDSEDSDREENPLQERHVIFRMKPGSGCEALRQAVEKREIGRSTNFWIKFKDSRRAIVNVENTLYSARIVDLPCVIESHKTYDKKSIFKSGDISQMLLVEDQIESGDEIKESDSQNLTGDQFAHGITPPLKYVRKRRFRERMSQKQIQMIEEQVDRLLSADTKAEYSTYEILDRKAYDREVSVAASNYSNGNYERYGSSEITEKITADAEEDVLAGQIEQSMLEFEKENTHESSAPPVLSDFENERAIGNLVSDHDDEEDEMEADEEDDDESDAGDIGDTRLRSNQHQKLIRSRISELEEAIIQKRKQAENVANPIIRSRFLGEVAKLESELELQRSEMAEDDDA